MQEVLRDECNTLRFRQNKIVRMLLDAGPFDLNQLQCMPFSDEDREQLAQLIGYSLSGFEELSYTSEEVYEAAIEKGNELPPLCTWCGHPEKRCGCSAGFQM